MNKKNKMDKRTFIPQSVGDTVKKINRNFSSKFGKIEFIIYSNWSKITGSYFAQFSEPSNITRILENESEIGEKIYKNFLNVKVAPAAAIEFQHFKNTILEKINSYFGYKAITDLRIQQNYIPKYNKIIKNKIKKISEQEMKYIANEVNNIGNKNLKKTLVDLGKNIAKESK